MDQVTHLGVRSKNMRLLLADNYSLFRKGLKALFEGVETMPLQVLAETDNSREVISLVQELQPDVVMLDFNLPELGGLGTTTRLIEHYPETKVIIVSWNTESDCIYGALKAGASGYVSKKAIYEEIVVALNAVSNGYYYISPSVLTPLVNCYLESSPTSRIRSLYFGLTKREKEVFRLMANSRTRKEIAEMLGISPKTVDRHRSNIWRKLKVDKEVEFIEFAKKLKKNESF